MDSTAASHVGAPSAYAALGPPDKMIPVGSNFWISLIFDVHGSTEENTCCSRTRRAISCVYCPPKSITTTPPNSDFGLLTSSVICAPLAIVSSSFESTLASKPAQKNIGAQHAAPHLGNSSNLLAAS